MKATIPGEARLSRVSILWERYFILLPFLSFSLSLSPSSRTTRQQDINDEKQIGRVQNEPFERTVWDKRFARMKGRNVQKEKLERIFGTNTWNKRQVVFTKIIDHHASILFYNRAPSVLPIIEYLVPVYRCIEHLEEARSSLVLSNSLP